jgi:hypothetical protein
MNGIEVPGHESVISLIGVSLGRGLDVGYSYDYSISGLGNANSAGAHEISIRYVFLGGPSKAGQKKTSMPCFKY